MQFELDRDTALGTADRPDPEHAIFETEIASGWSIGSAPNGGYLAFLVCRAMGRALESPPDALTTTVHFLRVAVPGPARVEVEIARRGKRHATTLARLVQRHGDVVRAISTWGDLGALEGPTDVRVDVPGIPPPDACIVGRAGPTSDLSIANRVDMRIEPGAVSWYGPSKSDRAELRGWVRLRDGRPTDAASLLFFADAFPPPSLNLAVASARWVPTLELTVHVRARPAPGWVLGAFRTRAVIGGYLEEDGELFDETGRLVAMSRQLARLEQPKESSS